jgi:phosphoheptose isomerase
MALFPDKSFDDAGQYALAYGQALNAAFATIDLDQVRAAAQCLEDAIERKATIFVCGNGGSASISNHFVCDHVKGVRSGTDILSKVHSLSTNVEIVTAIANDIGYGHVFEFQLTSLASKGDVLVAISSSGQSSNIVAALRWAKENGVRTILMSGFGGGEGRDLADIKLHVNAQNYGVIEDVHQSMMHFLAQYLRQKNLKAPGDIGKITF